MPKKTIPNLEKFTLKDDGTVDRRYTKEWSKSGVIDLSKVHILVETLVDQREEMIKYIIELHDVIDYIIERNNICDNPHCLTAGCTSDHK